MFTRLARCRYGILAPELGRNDFEGVEMQDRAAAIAISSPDGIHPHSKWIAHNDIRGRIDDAIKLGANAILLYNDDAEVDDIDSTLSPKVAPTERLFITIALIGTSTERKATASISAVTPSTTPTSTGKSRIRSS